MSSIPARNKRAPVKIAARPSYGAPRLSPSRIVSFLILLTLAMLAMYPFAWMLMTSLRDPRTVFTGSFIPSQFQFDAYPKAWQQTKFGMHFLNSVIIAVISLAGILFFS